MTIAVPSPRHRPMEERYAQIEKALALMGNTHSFKDVLSLIEDGFMQSFAVGETWAITQILDFPQKRVCEIFILAGELGQIEEVMAEVEAYARAKGCQIMRGYGRAGWAHYTRPRGWTDDTRIYLKELV